MNFEDKKKLVVNHLENYLQVFHYKSYPSGMNPGFVYFEDEIAIDITITYSSTRDEIHINGVKLSNYIVEDFILPFNLPGKDYTELRKKERYHIGTVHSGNSYCFSRILNSKVNSEELIKEYVEEYLHYFKHHAKPFIERYSHLPNILKEMDRLEATGEDWNGILCGMGDRLFRGILISRLCNDPDFNKKLEYCEMKFSTVKILEKWDSPWKEIKDLLPKIEPKYNI